MMNKAHWLKRLQMGLLTGMGAGWLPIAPGTWGSAVAILVTLPMAWLEKEWMGGLLLTLILTCFIIGVRGAAAMAPAWGDDPRQIVIDEMVGMWISIFLLPFTGKCLLVAFVLFRFFDIIKPLGIRRLESIGKGYGVMLDDVLAGVYVNLILHFAIFTGIFVG